VNAFGAKAEATAATFNAQVHEKVERVHQN